MADIAAIQTAIATALGTISGLRTQTEERDSATPPTAIIGLPSSVTYDFAFGRGADTYTFDIRVVTGRAAERAAQVLLAGYVSGTGSSSIKAALESDPTLGGVIDSCRVQSANGIGIYQFGEIEYLGVNVTLEVIA